MLGMVLMDAGRYPAAHAAAQKAAKAMPSSDQAYAVRGMAEMRCNGIRNPRSPTLRR